MRPNELGFTLIELLIVVAIIAILAAIAVPNFLEAQTRAKVTRTKADMRTVALALESYHVDNTNYMPAYPRGAGPAFTGNHAWAGWAQNFLMVEGNIPGGLVNLGFRLTTPIAYLSSVPEDPFWTSYVRSSFPGYEIKSASCLYAASLIKAIDWTLRGDAPWTPDGIHPTYRNIRWDLRSVGPCRRFSDFALYDPTNGTVSLGELIWLNTQGPLWK